MIFILFRIALAILVAIFLSKILVQVFRLGNSSDEKKEKSSRQSNKEDCIEICPECGHLRDKNHRCA